MAFNQEGAVALRLLPCTVTAGTKTITGFGTAQDFLAIVDPSFEIVNAEKVEYNELRLSGGVIMRAPKTTKYRDAITGAVVGSEGDMFDVTIACTYTHIKALVALLQAETQVPLAIAFAPLLDEGGGVDAWAHMMCTINGNIKYSATEGIAKIPVSFKGTSFALTDTTPPAYTDYNTAMCTATITPFGTTTALTIEGLTDATAFTKLLTGRIVLEDI